LFYGDVVLSQIFRCAREIYLPMATGIFRVYTSSGFVVAADGRVRNSNNGSIRTEDEQKIVKTNGTLAWPFGGAVEVVSPHDGHVILNFKAEVSRLTQTISTERYRTLADYVTRVCQPIHSLLGGYMQAGDARFSERVRENEIGSTIVDIFVDGYFKGVPSRVTIRFSHDAGKLARPEVSPRELDTGIILLYGSAKVGKLLFDTGDAKFAQHLKRSHYHDNSEISDAISRAIAYFNACTSPEALEVDGEICRNIGGRVRVASITPLNGFVWESLNKSPE
jgi:hypothetical protein